MVIVIIHWKIKLGDENRAAFLKHWKDMLNISERSLVGYLACLRPLHTSRSSTSGSGLTAMPSSARSLIRTLGNLRSRSTSNLHFANG